MKELSIEEKAKRYDSVTERANSLLSGNQLGNAWIYKLLPELKESESERIRKAIHIYLDWLDGRKDYAPRGEYSIRDMIAWVEKQGKKDMGISETTKQKLEYNLNRALEKETPESWNEFLDGGEQKHVDKVEPKFKVGDWIIRNNEYTGIPVQVIEFKGYYRCNLNGEVVTLTLNDVHNNFHLWTIEDAKGGDVLSFNDGHGNDCIELIKSITDKKIEFWFCLTNGNRYEVFDGNLPYTNLASRKDATPATKEQRDTLERAMTNAGYRWNKEKLKLEKI